MSPEEKMRYVNQTFGDDDAGEGYVTDIYHLPPSQWFHTVAYAVADPLKHDDAYYRTSLLTILAYADRKMRDEEQKRKLVEIALQCGNPMAALFGLH